MSKCKEWKHESWFLSSRDEKNRRRVFKKVTVGDAVYCTTEGEYVTLLEKPNKIGRKCKYKTLKGLINEQWAFCFRTISKGNATSEYEVKGKRYEERALYLKHLACSNRFRVETQELRDSILLKIFGDLQEEVDNFINLSCINDLTLF